MPRSIRRVGPSGPSPNRVLFLGEGPGRDEDRTGRCFTGPSGKVLWGMSEVYADLKRPDVRVANLSPYRLTDDRGKDRAPTEEEATEFAPLLREEIKRTNPELIVCLGRHSASVVLRRPVTMDVANGQLYRTKKGRAVIVVTHPAAGLYEPTQLAKTARGLEVVGQYLRGNIPPLIVDEFPNTEYHRPILDPARPPNLTSPCAIDTEGPPGDRWSLQWSCRGGTGRLVRADDKRALAAFKAALERDRPELIFHNALWDIPALLEMGIDILAMGLKWRDTMIESYLSQKHPHGLKPLAERLCGMEMASYESVVGPVAEAFARRYIELAYAEPDLDWAFAEGRKHSVLRRLGDLLKPAGAARRGSVNEPKTLREKWLDEGFDQTRSLVEAVHGPMPSPRMDDIPAEEFLHYACRDPDATFRVAPHLAKEIDEAGLHRVRAVDVGALPLILRMQRAGMLVDTHRLDELREFVASELSATTEVIRVLTGIEDFNPASGDQVAAFCKAHDLGLEKLTKSGKREQVDENALTLIRFKHPVIEQFLYHRELQKLLTTYIIPLYGFLRGTGRYRRLYGNFRLTSAITGRLSMNDPNLMAFPTRTELGKRVRACFVASEGHRIGSVDLSQIELRVGAGLSQDEEMMRAFIAGEDLHTRTASKLFGVPPEKVDPLTQRYPCKTANFAIFYGARAHRLEAEFLKAGIPGYDNARCEEFVASWFDLYSGVGSWIADTYRFGRENGFVTTEAGRRRYLPALKFDQQGYPFNRLREEAQRQASNFPVQGTAQEIIKRAMPVFEKEVLPVMSNVGYFCEPLLQIHDEVLFEVAEDGEDLLKELSLDAMTRESAWKGVPLSASWASGLDWASAK